MVDPLRWVVTLLTVGLLSMLAMFRFNGFYVLIRTFPWNAQFMILRRATHGLTLTRPMMGCTCVHLSNLLRRRGPKPSMLTSWTPFPLMHLLNTR